VAFGAPRPPGICHRSRGDVRNRAGAVVTVLAKIVRDEFRASDSEEQKAGSKDPGQPDQMLEVFERPSHPSASFAIRRTECKGWSVWRRPVFGVLLAVPDSLDRALTECRHST
jgi:hypothetical protein